MKTEFNFMSKSGVKVFLRDPQLSQSGGFLIDYKIEGVLENKHDPDGFYYGGEVKKNKQVVEFYPVKIGANTIGGIAIPNDIFAELITIFDVKISTRNRLIEEAINSLVSDKMYIEFGIVGCDFPHYQPWLKKLPESLKGLEQEIMEGAIKKATGLNYLDSNVCQYIEGLTRKSIGTTEELGGDVSGIKYDEDVQKYHGYKKEIVTNFSMKLSDILAPKFKRIKQDLERNKKREKLHAEMKSEILKKGVSGVEKDPYATVKITDVVSGESATFTCRNIFDFGYVVNPDFEIASGVEGGLYVDGFWRDYGNDGWYTVREATEFEKKAMEYLKEFPPIDGEMRM